MRFIADRENHGCQPVDESVKSHIGANPRYARGRSDMKLEDTTGDSPWSFIVDFGVRLFDGIFMVYSQ